MSRTTQLQTFIAACICISLTTSLHAFTPLTPAPEPSPDALSLVYDPTSGNLTASAPDGSPLTALEVRSASESFTDGCILDGLFDVCSESKIFHLTTDGFMDLDFGDVLPTGWTSDRLVQDLTVDGATLGGGFDTGTGPTISVVPEPLSTWLVDSGIGLAALALRRRRR